MGHATGHVQQQTKATSLDTQPHFLSFMASVARLLRVCSAVLARAQVPDAARCSSRSHSHFALLIFTVFVFVFFIIFCKYQFRSAELLVAWSLGVPASRLAVLKGARFPAAQRERLVAACRRRVAREPLQYILGDWDFRRLTLEMRAPVLIPRPETEELVGLALAAWPRPAARACRFLDIGCGTGAVALALLDELPASSGVAIDVDPAAVALTARNSARLALAERLSVMHTAFEQMPVPAQPFDLIVSNPPYLSAHDMAHRQPELLYEKKKKKKY